MTTASQKQFSKRRVFVSEKDNKYFQIFSFAQKKDGSIYCSWPSFEETEWLVPVFGNNGLELKKTDLPKVGKLSIHGKGMCAFRPHDESENRPLIIRGNKLFDGDSNELGTRHLFTAFLRKPEHLPDSPANNRESDYCINTSSIEPFVIVLLAIPRIPEELRVDLQFSFNTNDLKEIPFHGGFGFIELRYHNIIWIVYRTNHMEKWPKKNQVIYHDGYFVPFFVGTGFEKFRLELRKPKYNLTKNALSILI